MTIGVCDVLENNHAPYTVTIGICDIAHINYAPSTMTISVCDIYGRFPFTSPRRQHRRQTRQRLFTLLESPAGDVLSINGNSGNAGDSGFWLNE